MKRRLFKNSAILNGLGRIADGLYDAMAKSATGRALTAYDNERMDARKSLIATKIGAFYHRLGLKRFKRSIAYGIENSVLCGALRGFFASLMNASIRSCGVFFLAFGFYGALMFLLTNYAIDRLPDVPLEHLFVDIMVMIFSLPMILSRRSPYRKVTGSRLCNVFFFGLLGFRREMSDASRGRKGIGASSAFILGTFFGITTLILSPITVLQFFLTVVLGYSIFISPESGIVLTALLLPFASSDFLGYLMIYIVICYCIKLARGKRTLSLDLNDYAVLLFGAMLFLGGAFSIDEISFTYSVKLVAYLLSYVITVNLVRSKSWLERLKSAFILSVILAAVVGLVGYAALNSTHYISEKLYLGNEVSAFFDSSLVLALYLSVGLFFVIAELINNENAIRKIFMLLMCGVVIFCLYLTDQPIVFAMTLVSAALFFLIYSNRTIYLLLLSALILPVSRFILPDSVTLEYDRLVALASEQIAERMPIWKTSFYMMNDHLLSGSGVGTYPTLFASYASEMLGTAVNSSNIYIETVINIGIFGLAVFLIVIFFYIQHCFSVFVTEGGGKRTVFTSAGFGAVMTLILCGFVFQIWADTRIFLCMWIIMGISTAAGNLRMSERIGLDAYID